MPFLLRSVRRQSRDFKRSHSLFPKSSIYGLRASGRLQITPVLLLRGAHCATVALLATLMGFTGP